MVVGFLTLWVKLRYGVETKIDDNTRLTQAGAAQASVNAIAAKAAADGAADKADAIAERLNGGLDDKIKAIVREHSMQDDKNMAEINGKLKDLTEYVHQRNHDLLDVLQTHTTRTAAQYEQLIREVRGQKK
jgi:hypothetical protein